jgi:ribosomal protein L37AE/L43A
MKDHCKPPKIVKYEILMKRYPTTQPMWPTIVGKHKSLIAGYEGEKSIDFYLDILDDSKYFIFHGLRILYKRYYFQMDTLIISSKFALILEMKNIRGTLAFDNFGQVTNKKINLRCKNPVAQVKLQAIKLKKWLEGHDFYDLPIHYLFVNGNENSILISDNEQMNRNMCNSEFLYDKLVQIINFYSEEKLDKKDIKKINRLLLTSHTPDNSNILKTLKIFPTEILTGAECSECHSIPLKYKKGQWYCQKCKKKSKNAHLQAINDYFLLVNPSFTNSEIRRFLHIDSPDSMQKILSQMDLPFTGKYKNRVYHQP